MTVECSVVVPTYNRSHLLRLTLESLAAQTLPDGTFEVLVCDDGSTDDTAEVVASFADRLDVRHLHQPDQGYRAAAARNLGIRDARGAICVLVDAGVVLHSGAVGAHLDSHRGGGVPRAVVGYVFCFNEDNEDAAEIRRTVDPADPDASIAAMTRDRRWPDIREEFYAKYGDDFGDLPAPWVMWWACNVSAPTAELRAAGMFDEWFHAWGAEDVELGYRLFRRGLRITLNRRAAAIHWPHEKSYAANMASVAANYRYFAAKHATPITRLVIDHHFHELNDVVRERGLPDCADVPPGLVVVFSPHPDDDVIACGGTIAKKVAAGHRVRIVVCTDGAMSHAAVLGIHTDPTPAELVDIRAKEAAAAAAVLGVPAGDVHLLGFPDTRLADEQAAFRRAVDAFLAGQPEIAEVYLPHDVLEVNADHRLAGEHVLAALTAAGRTPLIRKYVVWDADTEREFAFVNRAPAAHEPDPGERPVTEDVRDQLRVKLAALREHRTQVELYAPEQDRPVVPERFVQRVCLSGTETFWTTTA